MTIEDRLRRAIHARTESVEPSDDGLDRITHRLLGQGGNVNLQSSRTRWMVVAAAALVVVAAVAGGLVLAGNGDDDSGARNIDTADRPSNDAPSSDGSTTTTTTSTTLSRPDETPPAPSEDELARQAALWPRASSDVRFDDPAAATRSFARYYAHFTDPIIGTPVDTDDSRVEVPVQTVTDGPVTHVVVRKLADSKWYVTVVRTDNITVDEPVAGGCPLHVSGQALAFEGTVRVRVDAYQPDGDRMELAQGTVTGSGSPPPGPFSGDITDCTPSADGIEGFGILTLWTESAADGGVMELTALPMDLRPG